MNTFENIRKKLVAFRDEREWNTFHTPKNLAIDISVEAGELLEIFQWLSDEDVAKTLTTEKIEDIKDELADVMMGCILFAETINVDLLECVDKKIDKTAKKYPVEKVRGSSKKYTEYE